MTDRDALLRAVCADPDSDLPRLAFADWLDDQGRPPLSVRAEFIRVQCAAARLPADDPHRAVLEARADAIAKPREHQWVGQLPAPGKTEWQVGDQTLPPGPTFDRGFPAILWADTLSALERHADVLFAASPVRRLWLNTVRTAAALDRLPQLRHVRVLSVGSLARPAVEAFAACPHFDGLAEVHLSLNNLPEKSADLLAERFGRRLVVREGL